MRNLSKTPQNFTITYNLANFVSKYDADIVINILQ